MAVRIFEKLFAILNIFFVFYYIFTFTEGTYMNPSTVTYLIFFFLAMLLNYQFEGMKAQSLIYLIAHPLLIYGDLNEEPSIKGMCIGFFIAVCITAMTLVLFFSPSNNVPIKGNHDSGYRDVMIGAKDGENPIRLSVFYPVPKRRGLKVGKNRPNKPFWAPDGPNTVKGMFNKAKFSSSVFNFLRYAEIDADKDASLDPTLHTKKLPVMIFSHGIRGHRNVASGLCREFASQGFVVYSIEHNDGTSASNFDEKKMETNHYMFEDMTDLNLWKERIEVRFDEIRKLLDHIHSFPKDISNEVEYDLDRVVIVGHGFGGCTALFSSFREERRISHCVLLDPWLFALHKEILDDRFAIKQVLCCVNSEEYHPNVEGFNSWETVQVLFHNNNAIEDLNVMIKGTGHLFQTDVLSLAPLEFKMWTDRNPSSEVVEMYELANKEVMMWLKEYGFPDIVITKHTQIDEYFEKKYVTVMNKPQDPSTVDSINSEGDEEIKN